MEKIISFNELPSAVSELFKEVLTIKQLLLENRISDSTNGDHWYNLEELCSYLPDKPSKNTVYGWVQRRRIPHKKKFKKLYFIKSEIDEWLKNGKKVIREELDGSIYLKKKGGYHV